MEQKNITEFLSQEYKEFAFYTIENRAIASCIDGFKPSQRKVLYVCNQIWKSGNEKTLKVFQLSGKVASDAYYHHGNSSLDSAIINLAQKFKNNAPLLEEEGQFGSLRSPQAGASRYIGTKLSPYFKAIYKDFNLLDSKEEEGEKIEPHYFLPIIPTILINGGSGIAVGFASNILNRNTMEIVDAFIKLLNGKKIGTIKPKLNGFIGEYIQDEENHKKWYIRGKFEKINTSTVKITELPPSMTYEKYEEILDRLIDSKQIVGYDDNCKDNINYTIKFNRNILESHDDTSLIKLLKLEESETENFNTLDEYGKLKIFESSDDIINYFIIFRLNFYQVRKDNQLSDLQHDLKVLGNRGKFIKYILEDKIQINNTKKEDLIKSIESIQFDIIENSYDYLLRMPIHSLTNEMYDKLKSDFLLKKIDIENLKLVEPRQMYIKDLVELKKILNNLDK